MSTYKRGRQLGNTMSQQGISSGQSLVLSEIFPPHVGGSGNWLHEIYSRQPPTRSVLLVGDHDCAPAFDESSDLQILREDLSREEWTLMNPAGVAYFWKLVRRISALHSEYKFSEIHCARVIPEGIAGLIASRLLGIGLVCYIHGEDIEIARHSREHRWLAKRVIARADRLVCNSENSLSLLAASWQYTDSKVRVLHPGIDTNRFRPSEDREALRTALGWNNRDVILTISRLDERKGHDRLIEAMPDIVERVPKALYVIVGEGATDSLLRRMVREAGLTDHVRFLGGVDADMLVSCNQACDLFVLPNRQIGGNLEGFGIVLLEAQACGRPVIAGDSGGTFETMHVGESGLLVDCTIAENLVAPISELLLDYDRLERMGLAARNWMLERFSWDSITDQAARHVFLDSPR